MKQKIHVLYRMTSIALAICVLASSSYSLQGCSYREDYSVLSEKDQVFDVLKVIKLAENDELILNLQKSLVRQKVDKTLKSIHIDNANDMFGTPNWEDNQLVTYHNGTQGIFVPYIKDEKTIAFLLSTPIGSHYKSVIVEILSDNQEDDKAFSGKINFYSITGVSIASYSYVNGKYDISFDNDNQKVRLKSGNNEEGCTSACLIGCLDQVFSRSGIYTWGCSAACAAYATGVGLFVCIFCVGGPALYCLNKCCPGIFN